MPGLGVYVENYSPEQCEDTGIRNTRLHLQHLLNVMVYAIVSSDQAQHTARCSISFAALFEAISKYDACHITICYDSFNHLTGNAVEPPPPPPPPPPLLCWPRHLRLPLCGLLLRDLVYGNKAFRMYILSRSDIDALVCFGLLWLSTNPLLRRRLVLTTAAIATWSPDS
jgi:hypothetical protein